MTVEGKTGTPADEGGGPPPWPRLSAEEAAALLYREARLLDEGRLLDWLALFDDECRYRLPIRHPGGSDDLEPSVVWDDRARLEERVYRLLETNVPSQTPPSRTQHDVTNVEVERQDGSRAIVRCNLTVAEMRPGDPTQRGLGVARTFRARCTYELAWGDGWRIASKCCLLLNRDEPLYNLTFIV